MSNQSKNVVIIGYDKFIEADVRKITELKVKNAIIIDGRVYELLADSVPDECQRCALLKKCDRFNNPICIMLFDNAEGKRFVELKCF